VTVTVVAVVVVGVVVVVAGAPILAVAALSEELDPAALLAVTSTSSVFPRSGAASA